MYINPNKYFDEHEDELDEFESEFESELERLEEERELVLLEQGAYDIEEWLSEAI